MFYRDHKNNLCFDDGQKDWLVDEKTGRLVQEVDWFWYLRD